MVGEKKQNLARLFASKKEINLLIEKWFSKKKKKRKMVLMEENMEMPAM